MGQESLSHTCYMTTYAQSGISDSMLMAQTFRFTLMPRTFHYIIELKSQSHYYVNTM